MSAVRRDKTGHPVRIVELLCPRCRRRLLTSAGEACGPSPRSVPLCGPCLAGGNRVVMMRREYRSGPPDLIV